MNHFINISNHPTTRWTIEQLAAAMNLLGPEQTGTLAVDLGFPQVDPAGDEAYLRRLALEWGGRILSAVSVTPRTKLFIHLMGETGFCFALARVISEEVAARVAVVVVHSTTERLVHEASDGTKQSVFRFVRFRKSW